MKIKILFLFLGIILTVLVYEGLELFRWTNKVDSEKIVLDKKYILEKTSLLLASQSVNHDIIINGVNITQFFPEENFSIDTIFVEPIGIVGFEYSISSINVGIAELKYKNNFINSVNFYNLFDVSIEKHFRPSFSIISYEDLDNAYFFNELNKQFFISNNNVGLKLLKNK